MKKYLLFTLAFLVALSSFTVLLPSYVNAVSPYDDAVQVVPTGELKLYNTGAFGSPVVDEFDVSTDWTKYVTDERFQCATAGSSAVETRDSFQDEIFNTEGSWAVSYAQAYYSGNQYSIINIYWTTDDTQLKTIFSNDPYQRLHLDGSDDFIAGWQIFSNAFGGGALDSYNDTNFCGQSLGMFDMYGQNPEISNQYGNERSTTSTTNRSVFLLNTTYTNYPDGYEGDDYPVETGGEPEIIRPDFSWTTTDLNAKITHIKKAELLPTGEDYQIGITVGYCPDGYSEVGALCENYQAKRYDIIEKGGTYSYDATEYGDYIITVEYTWQECIRYPSYPATPDYCYMAPPEDTDEYDFEDTEIRLQIGKEYTSSGSTIGQDCGVSGFCEAPTPYEDCSSYGLDVGGYVQCSLTNFGTWLVITLKSLFIPNFGAMKTALDNFTGSFQSQLGFLYSAFQMLLTWLGNIVAVTPQCYVDLGGATFFGSTIDINFCAFEQSAPSIYNPMIIIARLAIAAGFVFIAYRRMIEILRGLGS